MFILFSFLFFTEITSFTPWLNIIRQKQTVNFIQVEVNKKHVYQFNYSLFVLMWPLSRMIKKY